MDLGDPNILFFTVFLCLTIQPLQQPRDASMSVSLFSCFFGVCWLETQTTWLCLAPPPVTALTGRSAPCLRSSMRPVSIAHTSAVACPQVWLVGLASTAFPEPTGQAPHRCHSALSLLGECRPLGQAVDAAGVTLCSHV